MLSPKIDLTLNRQFTSGEIDHNVDMLNSVRYVEIDLIITDDEAMTVDEYAHIFRFETLFGKRRHKNEKNTVFDKEKRYINELETHCQRCGKELRLPWNGTMCLVNLCKECNEVMNESLGKIPWKREYEGAMDRSIKDILFNSK